ncbi:carbohydrate ABC transporter permease [Deinococcus roseus]|uniref:Sn-glycerol-3-phosphate transport system permease protein UgpE n=1 Tax=Deinococcus roseus TaxID=392414 RepID=A0ABQ2DGW0_9DEIO|nr:carbohydrate ABC transporter permease [Deinococcus roseus]GGJ57662.1 sn-glycerol-3-phosphate transport system permease protein UgpE [Deinococcus roseus]
MTSKAVSQSRPRNAHKSSETLQSILLHILMTLGALLFIAPLYLMLVYATHPDNGIYSGALWFGSEAVNNFKNLQADTNFLKATFNSLMIAVLYTTVSLLFTSMAGFAFTKYEFVGKNFWFGLILATIAIPAFVTIIPQYIMVARDFHLTNTYWAVILPGLANTVGIFYMRQTFQGVHNDLLNAARIDGASEFRVFWQIALPVVRPSLAALAILLFLASWNDYLWPLLVLNNKDAYTIPVALGTLVGLTRVSWGGIMMGTAISTMPFLILFMLAQRHIVAGVAGGSVKG